GIDKTILSFENQRIGSKGIEATGDGLVLEDFAVENTKGNAIKVLGANGVTFRRVRTEWTGGPSPDNGAYGLYPVQCTSVLIDGCVAIGASDAGIYVGQSERIIVRNSRAEGNVAGIEIENSIDADVHDNVATGNTGGLLVFDLPGLKLSNGRNVRLFRNKITKNNIGNFAPPGNMVGSVPPGTGIMVLAATDVEIFENEIRDNHNFNVSVVSYFITGRKMKDEKFSPFAERVHIHDNVIEGGGTKPAGANSDVFKRILGVPLPQIAYDGVANPKRLKDGVLPREEGVVLKNNGGADFVNFRLPSLQKGKPNVDRDLSNYEGTRPRLKAVTLDAPPEPRPERSSSALVYRQAPPKLSDWGLFEGNGASQEPVSGVVPYDLNTELFADYAAKRRFVRLPTGEAATYRAKRVFDFPRGTVIAKTFSMPRDFTDPKQGEVLLETRILSHEENGWFGFSYLWNAEQTDAKLALGGAEVDVEWVHSDGQNRSNRYVVPSAQQCKSCHMTQLESRKIEPIGPKARHLNKDFSYSSGAQNQLAHWSSVGILKDAPSPDDAPKATQAYDASQPIAKRARAWLDINCSHCHSKTGPASSSGLDLTIHETDPSRLGILKVPVAAGRGSGGRRHGIVPGTPDESILVYRIESTDPAIMMPTLPRRLVDEEGAKLIRRWVAELPPSE
ncbi:MAG: SO2930 family diheme c-type cytochrome, partial [Planctomycetota bacterium]